MDDVRSHLVEQALVVGDQHDAHVRALFADGVDTPSDDAQGVDVEAGVGLVEDRQLRLEDRHLHDLVALLLAAGEPLVEVAVDERRVHPEPLGPLHRGEAQLEHGQVDALACRQRLAQELDDRDAGNLLGVLEGEEHARLGPFVGRPVADVVAVEGDRPRRDLVLGRPHQRRRERALAGPVGAHHGVDLAGADGQVEAANDVRERTVRARLGWPGGQPLDAEEVLGAHRVNPTRVLLFPDRRDGDTGPVHVVDVDRP